MKKTITFLTLLLLWIMFKSATAQIWAPVGGPNGGNIVTITSTPTTLVAAVNASVYGPGGLWLSSNDGLSWANVAENCPNSRIIAAANVGENLLVSTLFQRNVVSGATDVGGVWRSTDHGLTWSNVIVAILGGVRINCFYTAGSSVFCGSSNPGVYRSLDGGLTWFTSSLGLPLATKVNGFSSTNDSLYSATTKGVYLSVDNGIHWTAKTTGIGATSVKGICTIGNTMFAFNSANSIYKSTDKGNSWVLVNNGLTNLKVLYASGTNLFTSTGLGVFKSTDQGLNWMDANLGLPSLNINCFYQDGAKLIAGGCEGLFQSTDNGDNWTEANNGIVAHTIGSSRNPHDVTIEAGPYIFAGTTMGRVYRSADRGTTWQRTSIDLANYGINSMFYVNNTLYVMPDISSIGCYMSSDFGYTWTTINPDYFYTNGVYYSWQHFVNGNRIYANVFKHSDDFGATWVTEDFEANNPGTNFSGMDKTWMFKHGDDLYSATFAAGTTHFLRSAGGTDPFLTISSLSNTDLNLNGFCAVGDVFYAYGTGDIYKSIDFGVNWTLDGTIPGKAISNFCVYQDALFLRTFSQIYFRAPTGWVEIDRTSLPSMSDDEWYATGMFANETGLYINSGASSLYKADITNFITPAQPDAIAGSASPCLMSVTTYSVTPKPNITYTWTIPAGWGLISGQGTPIISVIVLNASGTITVTPRNVYGLTGIPQTLIATPATGIPAQPGAITGATTVCANSSQNYSVINVPGVAYSWIFPSDWIVTSGATTNSVTVTAGSIAGPVSVTPSTGCGNGPSQMLSVTPSGSAPLQPSKITGPVATCFNTTQNYSVNQVAGINYEWVVPSGWSVISGQTTNSISVTVGNEAGNIQVTPSNYCGAGISRTLFVTTSKVPDQPGPITGSGSGAPCVGSTESYSVTNTAGISYDWTIPSDWTIISGNTTHLITVLAGSVAGDIKVVPSNTCGAGTPQTLAVTSEIIPVQPSAIVGQTAVCAGSVQYYQITNTPGVYYYWNLPAFWTLESGDGTNSITVLVGDLYSGTIEVVPTNACGIGTVQILAVTLDTLPLQPSEIIGSISPDQGSSQNYSVTNTIGVTYTWSFPVGWIQTDGGTSNAVTVTVGSGSGNITVTPSTSCGNGTVRIKAVVTTPVSKTLNLTSVLLEGLYNGAGTMRMASDELGGSHFTAPTADQVTIELHDAANYANIVRTFPAINLSVTGKATLAIPSDITGSYYITIKHRNSIETTTATAVSFAGSTISQSFGAPANVFGNNLGLMIDGHYVIYAGDVNQDGSIDSGDFTPVDNDASNYAAGYLTTDINGDGAIDSGDFTSIDNNGLNYIGSSHP